MSGKEERFERFPFLEPLCREQESLSFKYATYDIETESKESLDLEMIGFYDGNGYRCFKRLEDFFNHVLTPEYAGWRLFAHFGGRFDILFLFDYLRAKLPDVPFEFYCAGSAVISFTVTIGKHWWRFVDSYRLLPAGLFRLSHEFDVEHKKLPFSPTDWKYNRHDCIGLYEVLEIFFDLWGICSETLPAHAMKVWRAFFQKTGIPIQHRPVENDCRKCYFGGRTEVYRYDKAEVFKYDVNSLYPKAMLSPVPVEYIAHSRNLPDDDKAIGFYLVDVRLPEMYLPCIPYKFEKLFFPMGDIKGTYCTSLELRQAIIDGAKVSIKAGILFTAEPILAEFIHELHAKKQKAEQEGNAAHRYIYKIMMNAFYGKWGQSRIRRAYCFDSGVAGLYPIPEHPGLAWYWAESMSPHIMPHIAATITARARLINLQYLRSAHEGGKIYYTDTDSVFSSVPLPTGEQIGDLAYLGEGEFQAYGLKEYRWQGQLSVKGVPTMKADDEGKKHYDGSLAERYLQNEEIEIERMAGLMESARRGLPAARRVAVTRKLARPRPKRARVGMDTRPWTIGELRSK